MFSKLKSQIKGQTKKPSKPTITVDQSGEDVEVEVGGSFTKDQKDAISRFLLLEIAILHGATVEEFSRSALDAMIAEGKLPADGEEKLLEKAKMYADSHIPFLRFLLEKVVPTL